MPSCFAVANAFGLVLSISTTFLRSAFVKRCCNPIPSFLQRVRIVVSPKPNCLATAAAFGLFLSASIIFVRSALVIACFVMFLLPLVASLREESAAASTDLERKPAARDKHQHEI